MNIGKRLNFCRLGNGKIYSGSELNNDNNQRAIRFGRNISSVNEIAVAA